MRLFVAVDLEQPVLRNVERLIDQTRRVAPDARWLRPDQLHLTLSFLGEVEAERLGWFHERMAAVAQRHAPLTLALRSAGVFPDVARPRVLWLGVAGQIAALGSLKADLDGALGAAVDTAEARAFRPHLTLARSASRGGDAALWRCAEQLLTVEPGTSSVEELVLYRSEHSAQGVRYTAQLRARLAGPAPATARGGAGEPQF